MYNVLYKLVFKLFDNTVGRVVRLVQSSLVPRSDGPSVLTLTQVLTSIAAHEAAEYVKLNMSDALIFQRRQDLWSFCADEATKCDGGLFLEFGVWKGESINHFSKLLPHAQIYGFDSFEGLSEHWSGSSFSTGSFSLEKKLPVVDPAVRLVQGRFEETLPHFVSTIQNQSICILHLDADTYTPTKYVLNALSRNIKAGTILIFDEYFGNSINWRNHEFRAFHEFAEENQLNYKYLALTDTVVAIRIL